MLLVVEIPDIPVKEGIKALEYFRKKGGVKEDFLWKDGIAVFFSMDKVVVKGPKNSIENEREIVAFKNKLSYNSDYVMFYETNGYVYCDTYMKINPMDLLKEIPWIRPMKIMNDYCTRPVRSISLSYGINEEIMNSMYCGIKVEERFYTCDDFLSFYENKNIIISKEKKILNVSGVLGRFYNKSLLDTIIHNTEYPTLVFLPLEDKYMVLPQRIVDYIISKELLVFPKYNFSILEGFYFMTNNSNYNLDGLLLAMNSRLEDLLISYEGDSSSILFTYNDREKNLLGDITINEKYSSLGMGRDKEQKIFARAQDRSLYILAFSLMEDLKMHTLKKNYVTFLLDNYKNDYHTMLVEEYPELLGILSYYAYENSKEYNRHIHDALLSYSGEIKNEYGLLLYLTDKIHLLIELDGKKQLATSTKDPFGTKTIIDKIIDLLIEYKKPGLKNLPEDIKELFNKRIKVYFQNKYGDIYYKIKQLQNKDVFFIHKLYEIYELLEFTSKYYVNLKNIINRIAFYKDISINKDVLEDNENKNKDNVQHNNLSLQLQFVENILNHNTSIVNNMQYIYILKKFYFYIVELIEI